MKSIKALSFFGIGDCPRCMRLTGQAGGSKRDSTTVRRLWATAENALSDETTYWQYTHGVPEPDGYTLDMHFLRGEGIADIQLDLFGDYLTNIELYPAFQAYFRTYQPACLVIWGKHDPFFLPPGAEAYQRDLPEAEVQLLDTGHFALETHTDTIAEAMRRFLG